MYIDIRATYFVFCNEICGKMSDEIQWKWTQFTICKCVCACGQQKSTNPNNCLQMKPFFLIKYNQQNEEEKSAKYP